MSSVTVHLIFQGLIAFSPVLDSSQMSNQMDALAVDSRVAPPGTTCLTQHMAMIEFPTDSSKCIAAPFCEWNGGKCSCHLDRQQIELLPPASPLPQMLPAGAPAAALPSSNARSEGGNFSYAVHLSALGYSLDPRFLAAVPPSALAARFRFSFESLLACEHATRPDNEADNVHAFQFHKLGERGEPGNLLQAVAQGLIADITLDAPVIKLSSFDTGVEFLFPLLISNSAAGVTVRLMNHRPELLPLGDPCDDGIGRDFALFYELVPNPPAWTDRPLPHVKFTSWKPRAQVVPDECTVMKVPMSRPACPFVAF